MGLLSPEFPSQLLSDSSMIVSSVLCSATRRKFDFSFNGPKSAYSCPPPIPYFTCPVPVLLAPSVKCVLWEELGVRSRKWASASSPSLPSFWVKVFVRGNKQGPGAITEPSAGLGVKGAIITFFWMWFGTGTGLWKGPRLAWCGLTQVKQDKYFDKLSSEQLSSGKGHLSFIQDCIIYCTSILQHILRS